MTFTCRAYQGCFAGRISLINLGAGFKQRLHGGSVASQGGPHQRGYAVGSGLIDLGAGV